MYIYGYVLLYMSGKQPKNIFTDEACVSRQLCTFSTCMQYTKCLFCFTYIVKMYGWMVKNERYHNATIHTARNISLAVILSYRCRIYLCCGLHDGHASLPLLPLVLMKFSFQLFNICICRRASCLYKYKSPAPTPPVSLSYH